ncbi:amidase [Punctularia strigosozonata HHB-11173 SS5]|uniref:amidase n=1 Tax=Punctularia strigosozonata (strain HHB-11173) TaxID=741275 RepID=UPI00044163B6|nr:amidase [Punctularia strigosozonata HHB-11173 SS5]EIN06088.1 amidase [Punctularia strigosozonata HHB-11173 SS5]
MWPFTDSAKRRAERVTARKRTDRASLLARAAPYVPGTHEPFVRATAPEIVRNIELGRWTAAAVVDAYVARAAVAHAQTNCITEVLFSQAKEEAAALDREFAETKRLRGPLHGVPVTFKDQFDISGWDSSVGFTTWAEQPATANADIVAQVRAAGGIALAKTNVPQTMLAFECANPLWGTTTHPRDPAFTCGGSSGGEAALLAQDGAAIGWGTDIGGSLRIPAAYCGIYSLKPSSRRVSLRGARDPVSGFEGVRTVAGPMARSVEEIELACRAVFGFDDPCADVVPLPYRDVVLPPKLKVGFWTDGNVLRSEREWVFRVLKTISRTDGFAKASPACKRAVLEAVDALRRDGHECVEIAVPGGSEAMQLFMGLTSADGYRTVKSHLGPDKMESSLTLTLIGPTIWGWARQLIVWMLRYVIGDEHYAQFVENGQTKRMDEYYRWNVRRDAYARRFYDEVWNKHGLDGIVSPVQALPVLAHGQCKKLSGLAHATVLYNIVDCPVGVLPVTRVDPKRDALTPEWTKARPGATGSALLEGMLYRDRRPAYDAAKLAGMPVGVQLVGRRWEEENVVEMMKVLDRALGVSRGFGPGSVRPPA